MKKHSFSSNSLKI